MVYLKYEIWEGNGSNYLAYGRRSIFEVVLDNYQRLRRLNTLNLIERGIPGIKPPDPDDVTHASISTQKT